MDEFRLKKKRPIPPGVFRSVFGSCFWNGHGASHKKLVFFRCPEKKFISWSQVATSNQFQGTRRSTRRSTGDSRWRPSGGWWGCPTKNLWFKIFEPWKVADLLWNQPAGKKWLETPLLKKEKHPLQEPTRLQYSFQRNGASKQHKGRKVPRSLPAKNVTVRKKKVFSQKLSGIEPKK